jgi:hypothetical protein
MRPASALRIPTKVRTSPNSMAVALLDLRNLIPEILLKPIQKNGIVDLF